MANEVQVGYVATFVTVKVMMTCMKGEKFLWNVTNCGYSDGEYYLTRPML